MKILMLTGSPRRRGVTAELAAAFVEGAESAGHTVQRCDAAFMKVTPCKACYYCRQHDGVCAKQDDMTPLLSPDGAILSADVIALVTPVYYFGMTAQLKTVIDRFYALARTMRDKNQRAVLLSAAGDSEIEVFDPLLAQYRALCRWTHWQEAGTVLAADCHEPAQLAATDYLQAARALGATL